MERVNWTPEETAERLRLSVETLAAWRRQGNRGPKFRKFGRRVLYPLSEIEAYERECLRASTCEVKP